MTTSIPNFLRTNNSTGWTLFEKLYIYKGTVYIVSDHPHTVPDVQFILSKGVPIRLGEEAEEARLPTENEIKVISSKESKKLFGGTSANVIDGFSVRILFLICNALIPTHSISQFLVNDPPQLFVVLSSSQSPS